MEHLTQEQIFTHVLDSADLPPEERVHLETCSECQNEVQAITSLVSELRIVRASQPSADTLAAYQTIFKEHGPSRRGALTRAWNWVSAALVSDSRMQPLPASSRSVRSGSYRLLYDSPQADIELFVEGDGSSRWLQGDVILSEPDANDEEDANAAGDMLVQLQDLDTLDILFETKTDDEGRFRFDIVPMGDYRLLVTGLPEEFLEISELKIT